MMNLWGMSGAYWLASCASFVFASLSFATAPSYETHIRPILEQRCGHFHSDPSAKNGLALTSREGLIRGGKTGAATQPGSLRENLIWTFIATDKMPADDEKLTAEQKDTLRRWILAGAPVTDEEAEKLAADQRRESPAISKENENSKTYPGIYEIDDDHLRISYAETSPRRPTKFESDGHDNLFVCERMSDEPLPLSD